MESDLTIAGAGQQMPVQQIVQSKVRGSAKVLESVSGKPIVLELQFDPQSASQLIINAQVQVTPFPFAGQSLRVYVQSDEITAVVGVNGPIPLDASVLGSLEAWTLFHDALLPSAPVDAGDEWQARIMASGGTMENNMTYSLRGFDQSAGLQVANVDWSGTVHSTVPESKMDGEISGAAVLDANTGITIDWNGSGNVVTDGTMRQMGETYTIRGDGRIAIQRWIAYGERSLPSVGMPPVAQTPKWGGAADGSQAQNTQRQPEKQLRGGGDPRLVGVFKGESVYYNNDVGVNTQLYWVFDGAGGVYYGAQTHWMASARDYNLDLVWTADGTTDPNADRGNWQADGTFLTIQWENGNTSRFAYGFEPNGALVFRNAQTRKLINFYDRLR